MAEKMSTALCNKLLDTDCFKDIFATGEIRIYSGAVPATADAAAGTVIATVKQAGSALTWGSASSGVIGKSATAWTDPAPVGGVATYYRLVNAADDNLATSGVYPRIQGTVGTAGADMNLSSTTIPATTPAFTINYYTQAFVPS